MTAPTRDAFLALLNEEADTFRLTIRGHAAVEGKLDDLLRDAFPAGMPPFLKGPGFSRKLELVIALGLVPDTFKDPINRLTKLRNDFSHGRLTDLDLPRAKDLVSGLVSVAPPIRESVAPITNPRSLLMVTLGIIFFGLVGCEDTARQERARIEAALDQHGQTIAEVLAEAMLSQGKSTLTIAEAIEALANEEGSKMSETPIPDDEEAFHERMQEGFEELEDELPESDEGENRGPDIGSEQIP